MGKDKKTVHETAAEYITSEDEGFANYVETSVDLGPWLLVGTTLLCLFVMVVVMPMLVCRKRARRKAKNVQDEITLASGDGYVEMKEGVCKSSSTSISARAHGFFTRRWAATQVETEHKKENESDTRAKLKTIFSFDQETKRILSRAVPFTIGGLCSSVMSNICLALIGRQVGTRPLAAYALVQILCGLTDGILFGPISACTTLCAHAVGSGNSYLGGQYIQLSAFFYVTSYIPVICFWWTYMEEVVKFLEWGDEATAALAQDFTRLYVWTYVMGGVSEGLWQILEVAGHVVEGTVVSIVWGIANVLVIAVLVSSGQEDTTLFQVGLAYIATSVFFVAFTLVLAESRGWLQPFKRGLFQSFALRNGTMVKSLLKQAIPLGVGSLLSNAEWAVLTFFASYLGPAEVAAWAILGSIWDVFYTTTSGIGDAAELRVAYHFGNNDPEMARHSGYKALFLSMSVASTVSIVFFSLQNSIPKWFTFDETLQDMLRELVPFVLVANLTMQFGMTSWSLIGAQGKYKLATWVYFMTSWVITMPIAAVFTFGFRVDLQGLASAVVVGYVSCGASLSYVLLSTNWKKVAQKIQASNEAVAAGENVPEEGDDEEDGDGDKELYAALQGNRSGVARQVARRNIRLVTIPGGSKTGLKLGNAESNKGVYVLRVRLWSPLYGKVKQGDSILALNGQPLKGKDAHEVSGILKATRNEEREMAVVAPPIVSSEEKDGLFTTVAED